MTTLLVDTNPMAYGSTSAALAILDHIAGHRVALVRDVSAELMGADPSIDETLAVDVKAPQAVRGAIADRRFDGVLVVSNLANIDVYRSLDLPIYFVDILFWFGASKAQPVWQLARRSWVQNFPGVPERLRFEPLAGTQPSLVGPLIRPPSSRAAGPLEGTLVNLGGARSRWIDPRRDTGYVRLVARVLEGVRPVLPLGPIDVATGNDAVTAYNQASCSSQARSHPHHAYLARLATTQVLLTSPGLNAVFEGLALDKPVVFLPPQNASQVLQLSRYEAAGLVAPGLNLPDLAPGLALPDRVADEEAYTRAVLEALDVIAHSDSCMHLVVNHVREQLASVNSPHRVEARRSFWSALGDPGGATIGRAVNAALARGE